jgi:16S rRNA (guanine966-N2)-methyltransferase
MSRQSKRTHRSNASSLPSRLRIIGGRWRSIPITFPARPELRPTPDRVRETIFNWLQPVIAGARCLDLFAGSGVLGIEALSRGAARVVSVDRDREIVRYLTETAKRLHIDNIEIIESDALRFLSGPPRQFDIVFLDPPYAANVLTDVCAKLNEGWLAPGALVYVEAPAHDGLPPLPDRWSVHRSKRAGQVGYHLLRAP